MEKGNLLSYSKIVLFGLFFYCKAPLKAQDTLTVNGLVDLYMGINIVNTEESDLELYVSSNTLNQLDINFAAIEITKQYKKNTFLLSPAFGRYMNNNYKNEILALRWIAQCYWQRNIGKHQSFTLGIFSSPFTPENWKSTEQLFYSRALAPEYVPYYLTGLKWRIQCSPSLTFTPMMVNGWQHISDRIPQVAWSSLMEFKKRKFSINWTNFIGKEEGNDKQRELRIFNDINATVSISRKWMFQSCAYLGHQKSVIDWKTWWQFNTGMKVQLNENHSVGLRGEVFRDTKSVVLVNNNNGLVSAFTAYFDYKVSQHLCLRSEIKRLKIDNLEKSKWLAMLNLSLVF